MRMVFMIIISVFAVAILSGYLIGRAERPVEVIRVTEAPRVVAQMNEEVTMYQVRNDDGEARRMHLQGFAEPVLVPPHASILVVYPMEWDARNHTGVFAPKAGKP